jgi:TP901 family phage tail tape measure protein
MPRPVVLRFIGDTSSLTRSFTMAQGQAAAFGSSVMGINNGLYGASQSMIYAGATLTRRLTLPISVASGVASKLAVDFETSMVKIETLAGESREQVQAWSTDVLNLSKAFGKSPAELADALYFIASSGIDATHALEVLNAAAKASVVGMGQTSTIADALTSAINAYGFENLSAARATDILLAAVREGKGEAEDFAGSIGRVIAPAQLLGVSFDEVAAAMSSMTLVGLSADESATALRQLLFTLAKPSEQVSKALSEIGLSADDVRKSIRERGLLTTLTELRDKVGDNDELLAHMFPNIRAFNGLTIMTGENLENTARTFDILAGANGELDRAFARTSETSAFKLNKSMTNLKVVGTEFGAVVLPHIVSSAEKVGEVFSTIWGAMNPETQKLAVNVALLVAAIGPLLRIMGNVGAATAFFLTPVGAVILAVVAVAAAFYFAYTRIEGFREIVDTVARFLREQLQRAMEWFRDNGPGIWESIRAAFGTAVDFIITNAQRLWGYLRTAWAGINSATRATTDGVTTGFNAVRNAIAPIVNWIATYVGPVFTETFGLIADIVSVILAPVMSRVFNEIMWAGSFAFSILGDAIGTFLAVVEASAPFIEAVFVFIIAIITNFWNVAKPIIETIAFVLWTSFQWAFNSVKAIIEGFLMILRGLIEIVRGIITGDWDKIWQGVQHVFGGIWHAMENTARTGIDTIVSFVTGLPGRLLGILESLRSAGVDLGKKFVEGLVAGIKGLALSAVAIAGGLGSAVLDALEAAWNKLVDTMNAVTNGADIDLPGPLPTVGLPDNMFNFLKLANGGIFSSPVFAQIGEAGAEAVIPLTRPRRAAQIMEEAGLMPTFGGPSGGTTVHLTQHIVALDPRDAARQSQEEWHWAMKTAGK